MPPVPIAVIPSIKTLPASSRRPDQYVTRRSPTAACMVNANRRSAWVGRLEFA